LTRSNLENNEEKRKALHSKWERSYYFLWTTENNEEKPPQTTAIHENIKSYFLLELFLSGIVNFEEYM